MVSEPTACIVLNQPSLEKFTPAVQPGGTLVVNTSLCTGRATRTDITVVPVPATDLAVELGNVRFANMIALGALLAVVPVVKVESILEVLPKVMGEDKARYIPINREALSRGMEEGRAGCWPVADHRSPDSRGSGGCSGAHRSPQVIGQHGHELGVGRLAPHVVHRRAEEPLQVVDVGPPQATSIAWRMSVPPGWAGCRAVGRYAGRVPWSSRRSSCWC